MGTCSLVITVAYGMGRSLLPPPLSLACLQGMGSVTYAMPGELLSPKDKIIGISIAQCVRMLSTAAVLKVWPVSS